MSKPIRLFRPVTSRTSAELAVFRDLKKGLPEEIIYPIALLGADIIRPHESRPMASASESESFTPLRDVVYALPDSGQNPLTLEVRGAAYLPGRDMSTRLLALLLKDPEGILEAERLEYLARMKRPVMEDDAPFVPHVTLAKMGASSAREEIREWVAKRKPLSVSLQALNTLPHVNKQAADIPRPPQSLQPGELLPPIDRSHIITHARTLGQATIPPDIFDKLRQAKRPEDQS